MIELVLPLPVTLNNLTHNNNAKNGGKGGRSKTKKAKDWYKLAQVSAFPFVREYSDVCKFNINNRTRFWQFKKKSYDLHAMCTEHMDLHYQVEYHYWYEHERHKQPCDVFNYEKQLSDFLVDMGFMLDDCFITDGRVLRAGTDSKNPRVQIYIKTLDAT